MHRRCRAVSLLSRAFLLAGLSLSPWMASCSAGGEVRQTPPRYFYDYELAEANRQRFKTILWALEAIDLTKIEKAFELRQALASALGPEGIRDADGALVRVFAEKRHVVCGYALFLELVSVGADGLLGTLDDVPLFGFVDMTDERPSISFWDRGHRWAIGWWRPTKEE